ncbi:general transcription factor IIH subunit TFB6 family [Aspergillus glaucus CBS 516.65]|uniref:Uncharacterized protein n=1 Tax=Aspergillus glaucus CBS 516.65 TaxID=1160497 RepID=A0A1L9VJ19_ASPGL|nr:hypothetical protein ASPGLDRAFT_172234 [Aspergillus glaucus CBS 516.65]OJJ83917.1 hypothetical protein ASPGLDRAFT_172234 [Aspergillus glaucus CBS 516.65]
MTSTDSAGGFIYPSLPSPAPSTISTSTATPSLLPQQRRHPLKAGSMKETAVINHLDKSILGINRRHAKKFSSTYGGGAPNGEGEGKGEDEVEMEGQGERGYESFKEMVRDIESLVDVVWVSGTPTLQIPYIISLAVLVNSSLPSYPFTPQSTFRLLRKLDSVFASLLTGEDADSGTPLAGFETRRDIVSMTEKVRIKSIAEACRMVVMEVRERSDETTDGDGDATGESEVDSEDEEMEDVIGDANANATNGNINPIDEYHETPGRWEMEAARVYERTIQLLGDELGRQGEFGDDIGQREITPPCAPSTAQ